MAGIASAANGRGQPSVGQIVTGVGTASPPHARRGWFADRWLAFTLAAIALPVAVVTTAGTLYWPGRSFPGFFLMENAVVPTVGLYGWTGLQEGMPFHARVIEADGRRIRTQADLYDYVASLPVGTPVRYEVEKDGSRLTRTVPTMRFGLRDYWLTVGTYVVTGCISLILGVAVSLLRPRTPAALAFLLIGFFEGLFPLTGTALYHPELSRLSRLHFVTQATFPAAFIHFGLVFPIERPFVRRRPVWLAAPYVVSALLTLWIFHDVYADPPRTEPLDVAYFYSAASIGVFLVFFTLTYWTNRTPVVRSRQRVLVPSLVLATAIGIYGFANTANSGGTFPINLAALPSALVFLSIAYAIVRHDLFDINALLRRTAVYFALTLGVTGLYAFALVLLGLVLPPQVVQASPAFHIGFVVLVAFLFQPLRARFQDAVDRTFHRGRLDYRRTVGEVSAVLISVLDLDEILDLVGRTVYEAFQVHSAAVVLWLESGPQVWRYRERPGRMVQDDALPPCDGVRTHLAAGRGVPLVVPDPEDRDAAPLAQELAHEVTALDAALVVPITLGDALIGAFVLGSKRSGLPFDREDLELLRTLTAQSAIAVQNALSYRALQTLNASLEARVQSRTAELERSNEQLERAYRELTAAQAQLLQTEKMASLGQLVAGVAHEINNPVSFIVGNLEPLREKLAVLRAQAAHHDDPELVRLAERISRLFEIMARGAERTAGIVTDLRTFSRVGEALPRSTDVHDGIEVSLRLLKPRWADRIRVHRDYGDLPAVQATPGQLNQVFMNLLANACDAIAARGNIWIRTAHEGADLTITIRDDGAGIAAEHLSRIFDPFFTTKPQGRGTGLGLSISHGIIAQHGGSIRVASEPGEGTEFTVVLPLRTGRGASRAVGSS